MNTYEKIKTFDDACKVLRLNPKKVLPDFSMYPKHDHAAMIAHAKLVIIARAANRLANKGKQWKPDWNNYSERKYYPWFQLGGSFGVSGLRLRWLGFGFVCRLSPLLYLV